ncbi:hypothetical protein [Rhodococcus phenolicus]|uniref:hypothetical protein n=1 Tax=Rhodococcus phenolicus TaxID=263849 RepID=UPI00082B81A5|nr:hypothetical protein [Rhodococcus phenolicus]
MSDANDIYEKPSVQKFIDVQISLTEELIRKSTSDSDAAQQKKRIAELAEEYLEAVGKVRTDGLEILLNTIDPTIPTFQFVPADEI